MAWLLMIGGFAALVLGANALVEGAASMGKRMNIPSAVIGLTIVSNGTSAPEMIISLMASAQGKTDLAIANVVGSNLFNTLLILGVASLVFPIRASGNLTYKEIPLSLLSALVLGIIANDIFLDRSATNIISRSDGLVLLGFFAVFAAYTIDLARKGSSDSESIKVYPWAASVLMFVAGLVGLYFGGRWMVGGATEIATMYGMSETLVGITIVATATSLPELATSVIAAFKRNPGIALGNAIGSNIFNIFLILGLSAVIHPLPFQSAMNFDLGLFALANLLVIAMIFIGKGKTISRPEGSLFILLYAAYILYAVMKV